MKEIEARQQLQNFTDIGNQPVLLGNAIIHELLKTGTLLTVKNGNS